jgi:hypothetical protein
MCPKCVVMQKFKGALNFDLNNARCQKTNQGRERVANRCDFFKTNTLFKIKFENNIIFSKFAHLARPRVIETRLGLVVVL